MPQGLQVFNASGNCILDVTDRLTMVLGEFDTGLINGSITNDMLLNGEVWHNVSVYAQGYFNPPAYRCLKITVVGNTLSWEHKTNRIAKANYHVVYGVC